MRNEKMEQKLVDKSLNSRWGNALLEAISTPAQVGRDSNNEHLDIRRRFNSNQTKQLAALDAQELNKWHARIAPVDRKEGAV